MRRCNTRCARLPLTVIGSFEANSGVSAFSSSRSTDSPS